MARNGGKSPIKYFADLGAYDYGCYAAHCVHLRDGDIDILKKHKVDVCTCPKGNLKLGSGICDVHALQKAGVNVALGTDGQSSNNNINIPEEMRFFSYLQKGTYNDPTIVSPANELYSATRAVAKAMGRNAGYVKEGFDADICVLDFDQPHLWPSHNKLNDLVFSASGADVVLTMCNGRVLYKDGEYTTIDIEKVEAEVKKSTKRIMADFENAK